MIFLYENFIYTFYKWQYKKTNKNFSKETNWN